MSHALSSVLLIEDNAGDARLVREQLSERFGDSCQLHEASSLASGLSWLDSHRPDLILLDLSLPDSQGLETFLAVRAHAPDTPVVILSGHDDDELALDAVRAGAHDYLAKQHADGVALVRSMRHAVERHKVETALRNDELEDRVAQRTAQLEAANAELALFNRSIAHDLRTPLNAIVGFATLLEQTGGVAATEKARHQLEMVHKSALGMGDLVNAMLALSQVERSKFRRQPLDLSAMAQDVLAQLQAAQPDRAVTLDIEPGVQAQGDPALVRDVLVNLLGNAWKYTGQTAKPWIRFAIERHPGSEPVYVVQDNGVGFDMKDSDMLFQPFHRLASSAGFEGTGVGLATVRRILQRHEGRVWAESRPGERTCFFFTLGTASS
ncbi:sensor histidine kinase [Roseateles sp. P5_E7]